MEEHVLVDVVRDLLELGIVLLAELEDGDLAVPTEGRDELLVQALATLLAKGRKQALVVEGHRHQRTGDVGENLVGVGRPVGEAGEELVHAVVIGVIDVRTVSVDEDARLVLAVVGVARDVGTALEERDLVVAGLGETAGAYGAGIARADDDGVVAIGIEVLGKAVGDGHGFCRPFRSDSASGPREPAAQGGPGTGRTPAPDCSVDSSMWPYNESHGRRIPSRRA